MSKIQHLPFWHSGIQRRGRNSSKIMLGSAFETWDVILINGKKSNIIRTHPEELLVVQCKKFCYFWNICKDFYIEQYYDFVQQCLGTRFNYKFDKSKPDGVFRKLIDSNIAKSKFNWIPKTDIKVGISKTIDFYRKNYEL